MKCKSKFKELSIVTFLVIVVSAQLNAQYKEGELHWGFKASPAYSYFAKDELVSTIYPPFVQCPCRTHEDGQRLGGSLGFYLYYRGLRNYFAFQPELNYSFKIKGKPDKIYDLKIIETFRDSNVYFQFNYEYLNIAPIFKFYPFKENKPFFITFGGQVGINVAADKIVFQSDSQTPAMNLFTQQAYRNSLKGITNLSAVVGLGFEAAGPEKDSPFNLEVRYYHGLKDVIETKANNLQAIETSNRFHYVELSFGFTFQLDDGVTH